jgi:hypothetical protein
MMFFSPNSFPRFSLSLPFPIEAIVPTDNTVSLEYSINIGTASLASHQVVRRQTRDDLNFSCTSGGLPDETNQIAHKFDTR